MFAPDLPRRERSTTLDYKLWFILNLTVHKCHWYHYCRSWWVEEYCLYKLWSNNLWKLLTAMIWCSNIDKSCKSYLGYGNQIFFLMYFSYRKWVISMLVRSHLYHRWICMTNIKWAAPFWIIEIMSRRKCIGDCQNPIGNLSKPKLQNPILVWLMLLLCN